MLTLSPKLAFQAAADAIATEDLALEGFHESGVGARCVFASKRCDATGTRAGGRVVATVERGIPVLSRQSPADGACRLASDGRERRTARSLLRDLSQAERARPRTRADGQDPARQLARVLGPARARG